MDKKKLLKTSGSIFLILSISRIIGFLREMLIAYRFGSGIETDAFFIAISIQSTIFLIFAAGLSVAVIPVLSQIKKDGGCLEESKYISGLLNLLGIISIFMMLIGFAFAEILVKIFAVGFIGKQLQLAVLLTRISMLIVIFHAVSAVLMAYNHSLGKFIVASTESIVFNIPILIFLSFFYKNLGIKGLMISFLVGYVLRVSIAYIPLAKTYKYSMVLVSEKEHLKKTLNIMGPVIIGSIVGQVNLIVDRTLASRLATGSISALSYAGKAKGVVVSLFLASVVMVVYPKISEYISRDEGEKLQGTMTYSMDLILIMVVPALTGLAVLNYPIIKVLFYRGAFTETNVAMTSSALFFYSLGLVGAGVSLLVDKVYFALHDSKTPMKIGMVAVALNIALNVILVGPMKHNGLALATSIAGTFAATVKFLGLRKKNISVEYRKMFTTFIKAAAASVVMGIAVYFAGYRIIDIYSGLVLARFAKLIGVCAIGTIVYGVMVYMLKVEEVREITDKLSSKFFDLGKR
jgi:putative peptidoglycan lipid II flippase